MRTKFYKEAFYPWTPDEMVTDRKALLTRGVMCCNAGGFTNGALATMFHLKIKELDVSGYGQYRGVPPRLLEPDYMNLISMTLREKIAFLAEAQHPLRGFLTGGTAFLDTSVGLKDYLQGIMKNAGLPHTLIWGQPEADHFTDAHYDVAEDTWTLSPVLDIPPFTEPDALLHELKKLYRHIQIDPGDRLFIRGREIPSDVLKKHGCA